MSEKRTFSNDDTLRLALEVAQLGFWEQDIARDIIHRSPEWARMLGYEPEEIESNLQSWIDLVHPDDQETINQEIEAHEKHGKPSFRVEHRMLAKDGTWRWILNWGRIVEWGEDGQPRRALGFHLDITDRKQAETALARSEKLATIGTLAGGIAHDFNNLLTVIHGNLHLGRTAANMQAAARHLEKADKAVARSRELTDRLLTFARGGQPRLEAVDLEQVLLEARDLVLSGARIVLSTEGPAGLPPVAGDSGQLLQVFQNLLLNARQFMPFGGEIRCTLEEFEVLPDDEGGLEPGIYLSVRLADQGPGIPEGDEGRIFDPFFTTRPEGKGLGLATAASIIRDHHGELAVDQEKEPGEGAVFQILLPVAGEDLLERQSRERAPRARGGRVLVVDDDEMVLEVLVESVWEAGFTPVGAHDGAEAVEMYREALREDKPFTAVLMDLTIPGGMGGKEAAARILEQDPQARVVVVSGYSDDPVMARHREFGFRASLAKPFTFADVQRVLQEVQEGG